MKLPKQAQPVVRNADERKRQVKMSRETEFVGIHPSFDLLDCIGHGRNCGIINDIHL